MNSSGSTTALAERGEEKYRERERKERIGYEERERAARGCLLARNALPLASARLVVVIIIIEVARLAARLSFVFGVRACIPPAAALCVCAEQLLARRSRPTESASATTPASRWRLRRQRRWLCWRPRRLLPAASTTSVLDVPRQRLQQRVLLVSSSSRAPRLVYQQQQDGEAATAAAATATEIAGCRAAVR